MTADGAGVDPNKVINPSNRVKASHRSSNTAVSLKTWARALAEARGPTAAIAQRWLASKAVRP